MPCRWHSERDWQGGGIRRHAAGNVLYSLTASLPIGPISLLFPIGNSTAATPPRYFIEVIFRHFVNRPKTSQKMQLFFIVSHYHL
jgi:hypothetical protein